MRFKLSKHDRSRLFAVLLLRQKNWNKISADVGVSTRTLYDWRRGKFLIPGGCLKKLIKLAGFNEDDFKSRKFSEFWHIAEAGRKGGIARMKLYGNLGTLEGRKRGGLASLAIHKRLGTGFKILKSINRPAHSEQLAECIGALAGDGHLSNYQVMLTTNALTDRQHALFFQELIRNLFGVESSLKKKRGQHAINVVVSSKSLVKFLHSQGLPIGNKLKNNLAIPPWVLSNKKYQKAFIRGLFDTDGCVYLDIHRRQDTIYKHIGWAITSHAPLLVQGIIAVLRGLSFSPSYRVTQRSVYLRRQEEIARYFSEIGTSNQKHYQRYHRFRTMIKKISKPSGRVCRIGKAPLSKSGAP